MLHKRQIRIRSRKGKLIQWFIFAALLAYFLMTLISQQTIIDNARVQFDRELKIFENEAEMNLDLQREYASIGTYEFYEKIARDVFGYISPEEKIFYESNN